MVSLTATLTPNRRNRTTHLTDFPDLGAADAQPGNNADSHRKAQSHREASPRRTAEGSALIVSVVIIIVAFLASVLAIDFGRIILAQRSLTQAAEEAALSGALMYDTTYVARLDTASARAAAHENFEISTQSRAIKANNPRATVTVYSNQVLVTATAEIDELVFLGFFNRYYGGSNTEGAAQINAEGRAQVCDGRTGLNGDGRCSRPDHSSNRP